MRRNIDSLSVELLEVIFMHVGAEQWLDMRLVCHCWADILSVY